MGITTGLGYLLTVSKPEYQSATLGAVLVGSHLAALLPDLDQGTAMIWQSVPLGKVIGRVADPFIEHRNFSHSLLGAFLFSVCLYFLLGAFPDYWGIDRFITFGAIMAAYLSHITADMVTVEGVPLFFPYSKMVGFPPKPFQGFRIVTGKWFENLVVFTLINIVLILTVVIKWEHVKSLLFK